MKTAALVLLMACATIACAQTPAESLPPGATAYVDQSASPRYSANPGTPWPAVDALGRVLPGDEEVGMPRPDRFVGIFYFIFFGWASTTRPMAAPTW